MKLLNIFSLLLTLCIGVTILQAQEIKTLDEEVALLQTICPVKWENLDSQFDIQNIDENDFWENDADYQAYKTYLQNITLDQNLPASELDRMSYDELTIITECMSQRVKVMLMLGGTPLGDAGVALLDDENTGAPAASEETIVLGSRVGFPAESCLQIKQLHPTAETDYYWLKFGINSELYNVFCDMEHDGGGWTLWGYIGSTAIPTNLFSSKVGDYDRYRKRPVDNSTAFSLYPLNEFADTEMVFVLDAPDFKHAKLTNKYVHYRYPVDSVAFNNGPLFCQGLNEAFEYTKDDINYYAASITACMDDYWYVGASASDHLSHIYSGIGVYWGTGMGGNNSWSHNAWIYVR